MLIDVAQLTHSQYLFHRDIQISPNQYDHGQRVDTGRFSIARPQSSPHLSCFLALLVYQRTYMTELADAECT